jgi:predicted 2-oxoglutarate/Fe(II)-dependent dioxygenase YbiX
MTSSPHAMAEQGAARASLPLVPGALLPPLVLRGRSNPRYSINTAAGRWVLIVSLRDIQDLPGIEALLRANRDSFDDVRTTAFIVVPPAMAEAPGLPPDQIPGLRVLSDEDGQGGALCGADRSRAYLLDPALRVVASADRAGLGPLFQRLSSLPAPAHHAGVELHAPVLILPRVLEPALCRRLIDVYESDGGHPSGFMREVDGRTALVQDQTHKRRSDVSIVDRDLLATLHARIRTGIVPALSQAFQFNATRVERFIVSCYDGDSGGHFRAHRDNTTKGTAHRKFAVTINLNAGDFSGGGLRFPEFGDRTYIAPTGGAAIFSCSLLHEALPVQNGKRYAFLPFLYDEAGARIREQNRVFVNDVS